GRARAAQVLVRQVEQVLVVRVGVDGRHPALHDAERLVEDFRDWRETVRGARRIRNDLVLRRIVLVVIDAHDEGGVRLLRGRGDNDPLCAGRQVLGRILTVGETPRPFEDDVDAKILPRQLRRILLREYPELVAVDGNAVARGGDVRLQVAENRVVLQ